MCQDTRDHELTAATLHACLSDPSLESMNFLNEIASRYPEAVSFASGRPFEEFFDVALIHDYLDVYCRYLRDELGYDEARVNRTLFQYGRTKGILHELIARELAVDEGMTTDPEAIVVTVGAQEAMFLTVRALRADDRDILLAVSPTYVGLTGAARLADLPVWPVHSGPRGVDLDDLARQVHRTREQGLRPRACYLMPDFANPTGLSMTVSLRHELLDLAAAEDILLLEDNPYGIFRDGSHLPVLKALDTRRRVIYLGTFAKTGLPGARVGYVVADQRVATGDGGTSLLADELAKIKSMLTVNTSAIAQAVIGGKLLRHGCRMSAANRRETAAYLRNLRQLLDGLNRRFTGPGRSPAPVTWNSPSGGFFVQVTVPFAADDELLGHCAREYGVLWTPMSHFYSGSGGLHQIRLACSQLTPDLIETGLDRFAAFVADQPCQRTGQYSGSP
jgi:(S)-3,5-dihydroxyphenylglycine transaminase